MIALLLLLDSFPFSSLVDDDITTSDPPLSDTTRPFVGTARIQSDNRFSPQRSDFGKSYHPFVDYSGLLHLTTSLMMVRRFYHSSALISIGGHPLVVIHNDHHTTKSEQP